jgi:hypothetical protein
VNDGRLIAPDYPHFSSFIFKIQANMDPKHRDRIAFVRIVSGKFERDMNVIHIQSGRKVRLSSSHKLFGNERETVDVAYPGDIIGLVGHDGFGIGDTLSTDPKIRFDEISTSLNACGSALWPTVLTLDVSDVISVTKRYDQGLPLSRTETVFIEAVSHDITPSDHRISFKLGQVKALAAFILDIDQLDDVDVGLG